MMKKPILNTGVQITGKIISVAISLVTTGILTRKLGIDSYGNFVLISSLFVFLDSLADFGTKTIGVRELSVSKNQTTIQNQIFSLRIITAATAFVTGIALVWLLPGAKVLRPEGTVAMTMVFLTSIAGFFEIIFQSKMRMDLKVVMDTVFPLSFVVWLWRWQRPLSLLAVMSAYVIARVISVAVGYWLAAGIEQINWKPASQTEIVRLWRLTWPMGLFLMMFATYDRAVDSFLIRYFLSTKEVAWYGLAYKIYGVMLQPAYFYVNSIFPILSNKKEDNRKLLKISTGLLVTASLLVVGLTWLLAPVMVGVLAGTDYSPATGILRILIIAAIFSYMGHLVGFNLIAKGGQKELLKIGAVAMVFNLMLNLTLIPRFGVAAAAGVTAATEALDLGLMGYYLKLRNRNS